MSQGIAAYADGKRSVIARIAHIHHHRRVAVRRSALETAPVLRGFRQRLPALLPLPDIGEALAVKGGSRLPPAVGHKAVAGAGVEQLPLGQGIALDVPGGGIVLKHLAAGLAAGVDQQQRNAARFRLRQALRLHRVRFVLPLHRGLWLGPAACQGKQGRQTQQQRANPLFHKKASL